MADNIQSARFAAIAAAIRQRVVTATGMGIRKVVLRAARPSKKVKLPAEHHIGIRSVAVTPYSDGGLPYHESYINRIIAVDLYTRCMLDAAHADEAALLREDEGHYDKEEVLVDALNKFDPIGADGKPLLIQPLHMTQWDEADRETDTEGFYTSTLYFEAKYKPPMSCR